jgi:hypothetical protein
MKMRSKFLGINAKVALALLAVGSMFTSCYDTENGDVTAPYVAPDAMYFITGQVTDALTNQPVAGVGITVSGVLSGNAVTDAEGDYQVMYKVNGGTSGTVTVSAAAGNGYGAASGSINVVSIPNGQAASYVKNLRVNKTATGAEAIRVEVTTKMSEVTVVFQGWDPNGENYSIDYDVINNTNSPMSVEKSFPVQNGAKDLGREGTVSAELVQFADEYIIDHLDLPSGGIVVVNATENYDFLLPAQTALNNVSVKYSVAIMRYTFTSDTEVYVVHLGHIISRTYSFKGELLNTYHGHGHGHGHGGGLNAGGGIWE